MRSVGPFELTEAEFAGMKALWHEDERQLKNTRLGVAWLGRRLVAKPADALVVPATVESNRSGVLVNNQSNSRSGNEAGLETGESGETADVEAESEIIGRSLELLESGIRRFKRPVL
jgi:hypothetical protein